MTTKEKLQEIEQQIRKDIPRLMELREGCLVKDGNKILKIFKVIDEKRLHTVNIESGFVTEYLTFKSILLDCNIIGHEIMLNDVLQWLNYIIYEKETYINYSGNKYIVKQFYIKGDDGSIIFEISNEKELDTIRFGIWDLSKIYLKDQSERVINFLYNLWKEIK